MDKIETLLTPKEWAIRQADRFHNAPDQAALTRAMAYEEPYLAFLELAKQQIQGNTQDAEEARRRLARKYWVDFRTRWNLLTSIQEAILTRAQAAGLEAALRLQTLLTMILQDSFSRTAKKAAEWVEEYKTADDVEEQQRQGMLAELDAYIGVDLEPDEGPRSLDLGPLKINFPSAIQEWIDGIRALVFDVFRHRAAVEWLQDQYFDGHPILRRDIEALLNDAIQKIRDVVARHNDYLDVRRQLFAAEWDEDEAEGVRAGLAGEREGRLVIDIDKLKPSKKSAEQLARPWILLAKTEAEADALEKSEGGRAAYEHVKASLKEMLE